MQSETAVSAYFTWKQILHFDSAGQNFFTVLSGRTCIRMIRYKYSDV